MVPFATVPDASKDVVLPLHIGLVGCGRFGKFLVEALGGKSEDNNAHMNSIHRWTVYDEDKEARLSVSRSPGVTAAVEPVASVKELMAAGPNIVLLAVAVDSLEAIVKEITSYYNPSAPLLVVDVCSVKTEAKMTLCRLLPRTVGILCSHPMFGPDSASESLKDLPFVFDIVRILTTPRSEDLCADFLYLFESQGCRMMPMSSEAHDRHAAASQFVCHLVGRILRSAGAESTPIDTTGFAKLMDVTSSVMRDSRGLFEGMYRYNRPWTDEQLTRVEKAVHRVCADLRLLPPSVTPFNMKIQNELPTGMVPVIDRSPTTGTFSKVSEMRSKGKRVLRLCVGQPAWAPPREVIEATKRSAEQGVIGYAPSQGILPLRKIIAEVHQRKGQSWVSPDNVVVTPGAKHAIFAVISALLNPTEEVVCLSPCWPTYKACVIWNSGVCRMIPLRPEGGWSLNMGEVERALSRKTKAIVICSPNNPTGSCLQRDDLWRLAELLRSRPEFKHIYVISDDIYDDLVFSRSVDSPIAHISEFGDMASRTVIIHGVSKTHAMCGFRLGYAIVPPELVAPLIRVQELISSCAPVLSQDAAIAALSDTPKEWLEAIHNKLRDRASLVRRELECCRATNDEHWPDGLLSFVEPVGAFYVFLDIRPLVKGEYVTGSTDFADGLLERHGVAVVAGVGFHYEGFIRVTICDDLDELMEGLGLIGRYCWELLYDGPKELTLTAQPTPILSQVTEG